MSLNKDILSKGLILLGFGYFMIRIYFTGQIAMYVHPRVNNYILACGFYFIVLAIFSLKDILTHHKSEINNVVFCIFAIPLCIALLTPPASLSADTLKNKGITISQKRVNTANINNTSKTEKNVIKIDNDNFYMAISDLYENLEENIGKTVQISGYMFRTENFKSNEFVVGRTMVACCAADASIFGLLCNKKDADKLRNDDWYMVTGTLKTTIDRGETIPAIEVTNIQKISKPSNPEDQYVYP